MRDYSDILRKERPLSRHPRMLCKNRAKQFAPFDGLKGHRSTMYSQESPRCEQKLLSSYSLALLDRQIHEIRPGDFVTATFYAPAPELGHYVSFSGTVVSCDFQHRVLVLENSSGYCSVLFEYMQSLTFPDASEL